MERQTMLIISKRLNMKKNLIKSLLWFIIFISFTIYLIITLFSYLNSSKDLIYIVYIIENIIIGLIVSILEFKKIYKFIKNNCI